MDVKTLALVLTSILNFTSIKEKDEGLSKQRQEVRLVKKLKVNKNQKNEPWAWDLGDKAHEACWRRWNCVN